MSSLGCTDILHDVFTQKASMGSHSHLLVWLSASFFRAAWKYRIGFLLARQKRNMWPLQMAMHTVGCILATELFMRRERRRLKVKHLWAGLDPQWDKLRERLFTQKVTNLNRNHLYERLFLNKFGTQQRFREAEYRGCDTGRCKASGDKHVSGTGRLLMPNLPHY